MLAAILKLGPLASAFLLLLLLNTMSKTRSIKREPRPAPMAVPTMIVNEVDGVGLKKDDGGGRGCSIWSLLLEYTVEFSYCML